MSEAVIYRGTAFRRFIELQRDGVPLDVSEAVKVTASIVTDENAATVLVSEKACSALATNADWRAGRITVEFDAQATNKLPPAGTVRLLVTVYEAGDDESGSVPVETWATRVRVASSAPAVEA